MNTQGNLDLIRAHNALEAVKKAQFVKSDVSGLPALIQSCGLLATGAFALEGSDSREGMRNALDSVAIHLESVKRSESTTLKTLISELSRRDSGNLIAATAEAQAYLAYLKRFTPKAKVQPPVPATAARTR